MNLKRLSSASRSTPPRFVILDSNIVQYLSNPESNSQTLEVLKGIKNKGYVPAISDISFTELLDGTNIDREDTIARSLEAFPTLTADHEILVVAGHVGTLYKDAGVGDIDIGDKIISATAIVSDAIILTGNGRHFPQPFFREIARTTVQYTRAGRPVCQYVVFMRPDYSAISEHYGAPASKLGNPRKKRNSNG